MKIDFLALETTGLDPSKDEILEWCVATFDTETGRTVGDSGTLLPLRATCSDAVIKLHTDSGLFAAMAGQEATPLPEPKAADGRIVWAKSFACGFLPPGSPWQHASDGTDLLRLARMVGKAAPFETVTRAEEKVKLMAAAFARLSA